MLLVLILLLQLVLPLGAVVWLGWRTPTSRVGFWVHIVTSVLLILTAAVAGLWTALPWWLPLAYAVALLLTGAAVYGSGNVPEVLWPTPTSAAPAPSGRSATLSRLHLLLCALLALLCLLRLADAGLSRLGGNPQSVDLEFPLPVGDYLIVDAGRPSDAVTATRSMAQRMTRFSAWRSRSAGVDIVRMNAWGLRATGLLPSTPAAYFIYGTPVLAPCDGNVDAAVGNRPDQPVPRVDPERPTGNYVLIRCTLAVVLLANLRANSILVARGERVTAGMPIAAVGNSGLSDEPHLHIQAMRAGSARQSAKGDRFVSPPLGISFRGRHPARNDRVAIVSTASADAGSAAPDHAAATAGN